ncbi:MAG TPA: hypothetical protein VIY52_32475 [Streptosporangiaceae bacterium]
MGGMWIPKAIPVTTPKPNVSDSVAIAMLWDDPAKSLATSLTAAPPSRPVWASTWNSETSPGSPQNKAHTTLYLAVTDAAVTLGAAWIGIPAAAALATGTIVTIVFYLLVHFTSGQFKRK